jgi:hypothetical protein
METLDQNANRPQSTARPPEPLNAFVQAVHRGYIRLGLDGDSFTGDIADEDTWREVLEAAGAHPPQITGVSLVDDNGELHRLEVER